MTQILIIDDDPLIRQALGRILSTAGYDVAYAENGDVAAELLDRVTVDIAITDIWMPEREGLETIMHMTRAHPDVKIVAMSGQGRGQGYDVLKLARDLGATMTLTKPFTIEEALAAVGGAGDDRRRGI